MQKCSMINPIDEANIIIDMIQQEWGQTAIQGDRLYDGLPINGKNAILWMKENNIPRWRENEWPSHFIRFKLTDLLSDQFSIQKEKKYIYIEGRYPWDIRVRSTAQRTTKISLTDKEFLDNFIQRKNGYGLIVINIHPQFDVHGEFYKWHEELKLQSSDYYKRRRREGASKIRRKEDVFLLEVVAYYFPSLDDFRSGINLGWLRDDWQLSMRNSNDDNRMPKYQFNLKDLTDNSNQFRIVYQNLNLSLEDYNNEEDE